MEKTSQLDLTKDKVHFNMAEALAWQLKFLVLNLTSKKTVKQTTSELQNLVKTYGEDAEKLVLKVLMDGIDFRDPKVINGSKEAAKCQVLNGELLRIAQKHQFLQYFSEIVDSMNPPSLADFIIDFQKSLKLSFALQILVGLAFTYSRVASIRAEGIKVLMVKLKEYHDYGKPQSLPEYAVYQILFLLRNEAEFVKDSFFSNQIADFMINSLKAQGMSETPDIGEEGQQNQIKENFDFTLLPLKQYQLQHCNQAAPNTPASSDSQNLKKNMNGLPAGFQDNTILDPADILLDLGHMTTYNYDELLYVLAEFKNITEPMMASTLIKLANNHQGLDDRESRQVRTIYESCKKGDNTYLNKEAGDKKTTPTWSIDYLARAFRELYSHLNWVKVFESFDTLNPRDHMLEEQFAFTDKKAFQTFLSLYNKAKPQNAQFPLASLLSSRWKNFAVQVSILEHALSLMGEKECIALDKWPNKLGQIENLVGIKQASQNLIKIWTNIDMVQILINLSKTNMFHKIQTLFEAPLTQIPEHLLLTLARVQADPGCFLLDELYSVLLPKFLQTHNNSIVILENIWNINPNIVIRGMSELYKKDPTQMNLSRVLDITQEIKETLLPILNNSDYNFSVHLGVLAGKREFLHFEEWISERFTSIGYPFINEMVNYISNNVLKAFEEGKMSKESIYERSQLSIEKIVIVFDKLQNPTAFDSNMTRNDIKIKVNNLFTKLAQFEEKLITPSQRETGIDEQANEYFQQLFSERITVDEFLELIKKFMHSSVTRDQEISACMLHNLFDEYRFFHKYPEKELNTTAILFGKIIMQKFLVQNHLIDQLAIKYVQQALKRPGKLFQFGLTALEQFYPRLNEIPEFHDKFLEVDAIKGHKPEIYAYIEKLKEYHAAPNKEKLPIPEPPPRGATQKEPAQPVAGSTKKEITGKAQQAQKTQQKQQDDHLNNMRPMPEVSAQVFNQTYQGQEEIKQHDKKQHHQSPPIQQQPVPISIDMLDGSQHSPPHQQPMPMQQPIPQMIMDQRFQIHSPNMPMMTPPLPHNTSSLSLNPQNSNKVFIPSKQRIVAPKRPGFVTDGKKPITIVKELLAYSLPPDTTYTNLSDKINKKLNFLGRANIQPTVEYLKADVLAQEENQKFLLSLILQRITDNDTFIEIFSSLITNFHSKPFIRTTIKSSLESLRELILYDEEILENDATQNDSHKSDSIRPYRNIAKFIGLQTLGQNRPLFSRDLDLKQLLYDGCKNQKERLAVTITCTILREGDKSQIFQCDNPWIEALCKFLKEIYNQTKVSQVRHEIDIYFEQVIRRKVNDHNIKASNYLDQQSYQVLNSFDQKEKQAFKLRNQTKPFIYPSKKPFNLSQSRSNQNVPSISPSPQTQTQPQRAVPGVYPLMNNQQFTVFDMNSRSPQMNQTPDVSVSPNTNAMNFRAIMNFVNLPEETLSSILSSAPNVNVEQLKQIVGEVVTKAIQEILPPVVDRSVTIALITTRELVLKDFVLDGDEQRVREAALNMIQSLAGSLALVTCREPLRMTLSKHFEQKFAESLQLGEQELRDFAEKTSKDNLEIGCQLIQRKVIEQASEKLNNDETIQKALKNRRDAAMQGQNFVDQRNLSNVQRLPTLLKPSNNGLTETQFQVYRDFPALQSQSIQSAVSAASAQAQAQTASQPRTDQRNSPVEQEEDSRTPALLYQNQQQEDTVFSSYNDQQQRKEPLNAVSLLENIWTEYIDKKGDKKLLQKFTNEFQTFLDSLNVIQEQKKALQAIRMFAIRWFETLCNTFQVKEAETEKKIQLLRILISCPEEPEEIQTELTRQFLTFDSGFLNVSLTLDMIKREIIYIKEWEKGLSEYLKHIIPQIGDEILNFLAKILTDGIQTSAFTIDQIPNLVIVLRKIMVAEPYKQNENIHVFSKMIKNFEEHQKSTGSNGVGYGAQQLQGSKKQMSQQERENLKKVIEKYFVDVMDSNEDERQPEKVQMRFESIDQLRVFKDSDRQAIFSQTLVNLIIDKCMFKDNGDINYEHSLQYQWIDMFITVMIVFFKVNGQQINISNFITSLLHDIHFKLEDYHNKYQTQFNQKPFYRLIFGTLRLIEFTNAKAHAVTIQEILISFCDFFHKTNPNRFPAFAFAWLELISHKKFMPYILKKYDSKKMEQTLQDRWYKMHELLCDVFQFLKCNYYQGQTVTTPMKVFYDGVLRLLVAILHDYPEFFSEYHFNFVNKLPDHFIQLRNIILSAFPSYIDPPEPFLSNLKIDLLPEIKIAPTIASKFHNYLKYKDLKEELDKYFKNTNEVGLLDKIIFSMETCFSENPPQQITTSSIINAIVLYIAECTVQEPSKIQNKESMKMVQIMIDKLSTPARDCLLNSIFNEIRYPNSHTYFFLCIILCTFVEAKKEIIQEQIARILFERKTLFKPTPWGLMVMMRELLQNNRYEFTKKRFFKSSPDLENFFTKIFKSMDVNKQREQQQQEIAL